MIPAGQRHQGLGEWLDGHGSDLRIWWIKPIPQPKRLFLDATKPNLFVFDAFAADGVQPVDMPKKRPVRGHPDRQVIDWPPGIAGLAVPEPWVQIWLDLMHKNRIHGIVRKAGDSKEERF